MIATRLTQTKKKRKKNCAPNIIKLIVFFDSLPSLNHKAVFVRLSYLFLGKKLCEKILLEKYFKPTAKNQCMAQPLCEVIFGQQEPYFRDSGFLGFSSNSSWLLR